MRRVSDWKEGKIIEAGSLIINREEYKIMYEGDEKFFLKRIWTPYVLASKPNKVFERSTFDRLGNEVIVVDVQLTYTFVNSEKKLAIDTSKQ